MKYQRLGDVAEVSTGQRDVAQGAFANILENLAPEFRWQVHDVEVQDLCAKVGVTENISESWGEPTVVYLNQSWPRVTGWRRDRFLQEMKRCVGGGRM